MDAPAAIAFDGSQPPVRLVLGQPHDDTPTIVHHRCHRAALMQLIARSETEVEKPPLMGEAQQILEELAPNAAVNHLEVYGLYIKVVQNCTPLEFPFKHVQLFLEKVVQAVKVDYTYDLTPFFDFLQLAVSGRCGNYGQWAKMTPQEQYLNAVGTSLRWLDEQLGHFPDRGTAFFITVLQNPFFHTRPEVSVHSVLSPCYYGLRPESPMGQAIRALFVKQPMPYFFPYAATHLLGLNATQKLPPETLWAIIEAMDLTKLDEQALIILEVFVSKAREDKSYRPTLTPCEVAFYQRWIAARFHPDKLKESVTRFLNTISTVTNLTPLWPQLHQALETCLRPEKVNGWLPFLANVTQFYPALQLSPRTKEIYCRGFDGEPLQYSGVKAVFVLLNHCSEEEIVSTFIAKGYLKRSSQDLQGAIRWVKNLLKEELVNANPEFTTSEGWVTLALYHLCLKKGYFKEAKDEKSQTFFFNLIQSFPEMRLEEFSKPEMQLAMNTSCRLLIDLAPYCLIEGPLQPQGILQAMKEASQRAGCAIEFAQLFKERDTRQQ